MWAYGQAVLHTYPQAGIAPSLGPSIPTFEMVHEAGQRLNEQELIDIEVWFGFSTRTWNPNAAPGSLRAYAVTPSKIISHGVQPNSDFDCIVCPGARFLGEWSREEVARLS